MKEITKYPKWCLPLTDFNKSELAIANEYRKRFLCTEHNHYFNREMRLDFILLNFHDDGSGYWTDSINECKYRFGVKFHEFTKSEFFQLINEDDFVLPEKWCVQVTDDSHISDTVVKWNKARDCSHSIVMDSQWVTSDKFRDGSGYIGASDWERYSDECSEYTKITFEQFEKHVLNKSKINNMDINKQIKISRELLNQYYDAATQSQRDYLTDNFKIDGTTTIKAIIGLYDIACDTWKPKIKENHPECFEADKYFNFSRVADDFDHSSSTLSVLDSSVGLHSFCGQIRCGGTFKNKGIVLDSSRISRRANWEIVDDGEYLIAVPTKIK